LAIGILLVAAGLIALGLRQVGFVFDDAFETAWPLFVIVPGLGLVAGAMITPAPRGLGLAIGGSIVTSVGVLLFYQQVTGHWESWSYAWALIGPGAAGLGLLGYGLLFRLPEHVTTGLRLMTIATVLFLAGFWFFETLFQTGRVPMDLETWWPLGLVGLGVLLLAGGMVRPGRHSIS
jgi:hypothetical protein